VKVLIKEGGRIREVMPYSTHLQESIYLESASSGEIIILIDIEELNILLRKQIDEEFDVIHNMKCRLTTQNFESIKPIIFK